MTDKRKLLLIVPTLHQGGQERVVVRSARLLADSFDITIAIFDDSDIGYDIEGLDVVNLGVPTSRFTLFKLINILIRRRKLKSLKARLKPDISYSYGPTADIINALTAADDEAVWIGLRNYTDATDDLRMRIYIKHADLIICCARDIETYVSKKFRLRSLDDAKYDLNVEHNNRRPHFGTGTAYVCTLTNLYDIDGIVSDSVKDEPNPPLPMANQHGDPIKYICSMGRADDQKMFWHMLKTFKLIRMEIPETRLLILGAGDFGKYKRMAKSLSIDDSVIFAGEQLNPYKYLKDGCINWMTSRNEGFPNALVEGMALGLVTVSTNCMTGPAEILTESGSVYTSTDILNCRIKSEPHTDAEVMPESPIALYGEYGILTPAMTRNRDMDFAHITWEHYNLARVIIDLLRDQDMMNRYRDAAIKRAMDYGYEAYRSRFMRLADSAVCRRHYD